MRAAVFILLGFQFLFCFSIKAQTPTEYFIVGNANLYLPFNSSKGIYPVLGYDKEVDPKLLIGGFGVGFSAWKQIKAKISVKMQGNISRSVYWETGGVFRNGPSQRDITGNAALSSTDYTFGLTGILHYHLSPTFSVGTGLGSQVFLASYLHLRLDKSFYDNSSRTIGRNRYYKSVMPTIPIEVSARIRKLFFNIRYEHALLNRLKKDLAEYETDRYGLLFFEIGFKIR